LNPCCIADLHDTLLSAKHAGRDIKYIVMMYSTIVHYEN
jgi:hypothetical protein